MAEERAPKEKYFTVERAPKDKYFTVMSNYHLWENEMSNQAIGLLSRILMLPEDWDISINGLAAICKDGRTAIKSQLDELKEFGYLTVTRVNGENGRFRYEYVIHECPLKEEPYTDKTYTDKSSTDKSYTDKSSTDKSSTDKSSTENSTQLSTKEVSTKEVSTEEVSTKESNNKQSNTKEYIPDSWKNEFAALWSIYPRKTGSYDKALEAYLSARKEGVSYMKIKDGIERYTKYIDREKIDNKYILGCSRYFEEHRWNDEHGDQQQEEDDFDWGDVWK